MRQLERPNPAGVKWPFGPLLLAAGSLGLAVASGLIRLDASRAHAPLWIVVAIGVSFAAMGLILLLDDVAALGRLRGWLAFVFVFTFASDFNWVAFAPVSGISQRIRVWVRAGLASRQWPRTVSSEGARHSACLPCCWICRLRRR